MTTHLRARVAQAGALLAMVVGGITLAPAVALADSNTTVVVKQLPAQVSSGDSITLRYHITKPDGSPSNIVTVTIDAPGMTCGGECGGRRAYDLGDGDFEATLTAPTVNAGAHPVVKVKITATIDGQSGSAGQEVTVNGPTGPATVQQISGKVRDQNNKAVPGASVVMKDSAGRGYSTTSNGTGGYSFNASAAQPIAPGDITVAAEKSGYESARVNIQAAAGRSVNVPLTLKLAAAPTTSPTASTDPEASAEPLSVTSGDALNGAADQPDAKPASDSSGSGSTLLLLLGALLVAAGIGAIVLVFLRRRKADDDDLAGDPTVIGGRPAMVPPAQGRFNDATRLTTPMGVSPDATMVTPLPRAGSLADAPTMLHRPGPGIDEYPDPYGVPIPQQGGYAGAGAGGMDRPAEGYGSGRSYGGYGEPVPYGRRPEAGYGSSEQDYSPAPIGGSYGTPRPADHFAGTYGDRPGNDLTSTYRSQPGDDLPGTYGARPNDDRTSTYRAQPGDDLPGTYGARPAEDLPGTYGARPGAGEYGGSEQGRGTYRAEDYQTGDYQGGSGYQGGDYQGGGYHSGGYQSADYDRDNYGYVDDPGYDRGVGYGPRAGGAPAGGAPAGGSWAPAAQPDRSGRYGNLGGAPDQPVDPYRQGGRDFADHRGNVDPRGDQGAPAPRQQTAPPADGRSLDWMDN